MTRVFVVDMRTAGVCPRAKHWFVKHNLDWKDFVANGVMADVLLSTNDNLTVVNRVIRAAEEREARDG